MTENRQGLQLRNDIIRSRDTGSITFVVMAENELIDDVTILENADLFIVWDEHFRTNNRGVIVKEIVNGESWLFRNIHPIITADHNIRPSKDTSGQMWTAIGRPGEEYPLWVRPLGAHDAYPADARVTHNGRRWVNIHGDGNVWEPSVFGWVEVTN